MVRIARHWGLADDRPRCIRCGYTPLQDSWRTVHGSLQRAHLIDRCFSGLDLEPNIVPICALCHRLQPIFRAGDETAALIWLGQTLEDDLERIIREDRARD